jgi:DNA-binding NarL/FixJ family response regulator
MKILIVDDHALFRAGLRHILLQLGDSTVVIDADSYLQAAEHIVSHGDIGLALFDLYMPGADGLSTLDSIIQQFPALPIVVLSASDSRSDMQRAFDCGAVGFIHKSTAPAVLLSALRLVLEGGIYVPPAFIQPEQAQSNPTPELTQRQSEVLARVLEGKSNKAIAGELGLTEATVKAHVTGVFRALRVANRTQAAMTVSRLGLLRS